MTENAGRRCIFCDHRANSLEHIFPDWINKIFPPDEIGPVGSVFTQVVIGEEDAAVRRAFSAGKLAQLTARIVCCCCNGGWMSDMESRVGPLLQDAIRGRDATFAPEEQLLIAGWATKIAMLGEVIMEYPDSFTRDDRYLVRKEQRPPLHARVNLAIYSGNYLPTAYYRSLGQIARGGTPVTDFYIHTIVIGNLLIQVRGFPALPLSENRSLQQISEARYIEIPIFPPVEICKWPPIFRFDDDALAKYTAGGNDPPVPPPGFDTP
jgi:hypothetical protein